MPRRARGLVGNEDSDFKWLVNNLTFLSLSQRKEFSVYKINKSQGCNVQYREYSQ